MLKEVRFISSADLRSRSAELVRTSQEVALGSPETVALLRAHELYCGLLRLGRSSVYFQLRKAVILDEGLSRSLAAAELSDRILSCVDVPPSPVVDLRPETASQEDSS